jgi:methylenetetrahydrofolate dehydrogenase (NADP+)/methenyltetrahydrofolate cyclohydrolase
MIKIDGKKIAQNIVSELKSRAVPDKFLAAFLVGDNSASESFVRQKEKIAKELGVDFRIYKFDGNLNNDQLKEKIIQVISSKLCGGAILQLPLPAGLNPLYVLNAIPPEKDVDVLSERSLGSFYNGRSKILPPSVSTVNEVLKEMKLKINSGVKFAVVGQGALVGKPISTWLSGKTSQAFILDKGSDFSVLKDSDIVILGTGQPGIIKASMLKKGAGIIDFGYGQDTNGKISGDFDEDSLANIDRDYLSFYTPTPGGTGPILVACLFRNFYDLNKE